MKTLLFLLNPRRWLLRLNKKCATLAAQLLPTPYDPTGFALFDATGEIQINGAAAGEGSVSRSEQTCILEKLDARVAEARLSSLGRMLGGIEAGTYSTTEMFSALSKVDQSFIEAIERLSGKHFSNLSDLRQKLVEYKTDWMGRLTEGSFKKVQGSLGEVKVAEHLKQAGLEVQWPDSSNQIGWDLKAHGHVINVKTSQSAIQLKEHFQTYPEIPTAVPHDMAGIPLDTVDFSPEESVSDLLSALDSKASNLVIVDHALSHAEVVDQAEQASDLLLNGHGVVSAKVPYITAALSGFREAQLLLNDKTNMTTAVKNFGLDIAGTAGGMLVGGKAGAVIGTAVLPGIGTAVGSIIGSIVGALFGRSQTDAIKLQPLKDAAERYEVATQTLQNLLDAEKSEISEKLSHEEEVQQTAINLLRMREESALKETYKAQVTWLKSKEVLSPDEFDKLIESAASEISSFLSQLLSQNNKRSFWRKYIWPDLETEAEAMAIRVSFKVIFWLEEYKSQQTQANSLALDKLLPELGRWGLAKGVLQEVFETRQREKRERARSISEQIKTSAAKIFEARKQAKAKIAAAWKFWVDQSNERIKPINHQVETCRKDLMTEADKLGISLSSKPKAAA